MNKLSCLVLAGGKLTEELEEKFKVNLKCLLPVGEKPIIEYVLNALSGSEEIDEITILGDVSELSFLKDRANLLSGLEEGLLENLICGISEFKDKDKIIVASSDIPLITPSIVDDFIKKCTPEIDFSYPIIPKDKTLQKFKDAKRTYGHVKEGTFTGGNIVLLNPDIFLKNINIIKQTLSARKSPLQLIKILGGMFLLKFFLSVIGITLLSISDLERKIGDILGGFKVEAVIVDHPEIAMDIDKLSDLISIENYIAKEKNP
jgi:GTP:adenosylcobinamide-phosphate guanylyltransferase